MRFFFVVGYFFFFWFSLLLLLLLRSLLKHLLVCYTLLYHIYSGYGHGFSIDMDYAAKPNVIRSEWRGNKNKKKKKMWEEDQHCLKQAIIILCKKKHVLHTFSLILLTGFFDFFSALFSIAFSVALYWLCVCVSASK